MKLNISPSKNKHLKKGPLKNISPGAYFQNFTAFGYLLFFSVEATIESFQKIQHKVNLCVFLGRLKLRFVGGRNVFLKE